ncbi:MAG TPA: response regulator [Chloroflexota bacterium]|nr:response regulator [Chloroflexota bacterium]
MTSVTGQTRACVLVVEDDDATREIVVQVLQEEGYHTLTAPDGAAALAILDRDEVPRIGLILLDLWMPVMDGWQFAAAYRAQPREHAPIVLLTAESGQSAATHADDLQSAGFLIKPFDLEDLVAVVRRCLESGEKGAAPAVRDTAEHNTMNNPVREKPDPSDTGGSAASGSLGYQLLARIAVPQQTYIEQVARTLSALSEPKGNEGRPSAKSNGEALSRRRLRRIQHELTRVQKEIGQVSAEVQRVAELETSRKLTLEERRWAAKLRMEHERLRWEVSILHEEFLSVRDSKSLSPWTN